nr:MAG: hypothetical protein [Lokiarchaeota virus Ratatoskr Meg22_1012]
MKDVIMPCGKKIKIENKDYQHYIILGTEIFGHPEYFDICLHFCEVNVNECECWQE